MLQEDSSALENETDAFDKLTGQRRCDIKFTSDDSATDDDDSQSVEWVETVAINQVNIDSGTQDKLSDRNVVVSNMEQGTGFNESALPADGVDKKLPENPKKRRRNPPRITYDEGWTIIKVILDILKTECVPVVLEIVRSSRWEKTSNGVNLLELIQAEPNAVADRTGSSLQSYLRNKLRTNPNFLQIFESGLRGYEASLVEKLQELLSEFRHPKKVTNHASVGTETPQPSSSNTRKRPVRFSHTEERNVVFGICCLLEQHTVEDVRKCLRGQWNFEVEEDVKLTEFIRAMDDSVEDRTVTSFKSHWMIMSKYKHRFLKMFRELIAEFSAAVQDKFDQLVNTE